MKLTLNNYLNESRDKQISTTLMNGLIHENCKSYLKLIKGLLPMYRGMSTKHISGEKTVRKNRKPLGMSVKEANMSNKWLEENGHARRDKSVLCTSSTKHLELFGSRCFIFPLNPIVKYTWIDAEDINIADFTTGWGVGLLKDYLTNQRGVVNLDAEHRVSNAKKDVPDYFHTNNLFRKAHTKGYEMWIECSSYYYVTDFIVKWGVNQQIFSVI